MLATVFMTMELNVTCPKCDDDFDLLSDDDRDEWSVLAMENLAFKGLKTLCPYCDQEITFDGLEY